MALRPAIWIWMASVRPASGEALLAVLKAMGAPVASSGRCPFRHTGKQQQYWQQPLEPVIVVWESEDADA